MIEIFKKPMRLIYSSLPGRGGTTVSSSGAATSKQDLEKHLNFSCKNKAETTKCVSVTQVSPRHRGDTYVIGLDSGR